ARPGTCSLSNAGPIQSPGSPPATPKASFSAGAEPGPDPEAWRAAAEKHAGTWWAHWADWVTAQSGGTKVAPGRLGSAAHPPLDDAPGCYVRDLVPAHV